MTEKEQVKESEKPRGVFCISDNDSGHFPPEVAHEKWWQDQTGFKPAEEPKKPEPMAKTKPTKEKL